MLIDLLEHTTIIQLINDRRKKTAKQDILFQHIDIRSKALLAIIDSIVLISNINIPLVLHVPVPRFNAKHISVTIYPDDHCKSLFVHPLLRGI